MLTDLALLRSARSVKTEEDLFYFKTEYKLNLSKTEDDLNFFSKTEDDLNFSNSEDDLNIFQIGIKFHFFET